ncbi:MAG: DUF115 domain-containing protein [Comamonadaceae bacterium]|nr:DUF115 domain-containing protein [Comamonadaceae bacterium]
MLAHPSYQPFFMEGFREFSRIINNVRMIKYTGGNTQLLFCEVFAGRTLQNAYRLSQSAPFDRLRNRFSGKPAVVVSPGPSLSKNISILRALDGCAVIICTAPAAAALARWGIRPDFINAIEAQDFSYQLNLPDGFLGDTHLLLLSQCHPNFFEVPCAGVCFHTTISTMLREERTMRVWRMPSIRWGYT